MTTASLSSIASRLWSYQLFVKVLRWAAPAAILFLSFVVPRIFPGTGMLLIPIALFGLAALLFLVSQPVIGVMALIATIAIPIDGPSGSNATMALVAALLGLWVLDTVIHRKQFLLVRSAPILPLLWLVVASTLSLLMGQIQWYLFGHGASLGGQLGGYAIVILSAGAFLLVAHYVREERWLVWMIWGLIAIMAFNTAAWLFPPLGPLRDLILTPGAVSSMFWTWGIVMAATQGYFNQRLPTIGRLALVGLAGATLFVGVMINNDWKSGWVPPLISLAAIAALRIGPKVLLLLPIGIYPLINAVQSLIEGDSYSYGTRIDAWLIVLDIAKVNPILGIGFGNYSRYAELFPIRGYYVYFNSHSQYIDLIAQTGIVGTLIYFWFFLSVGWLAWKMLKRVKTPFAEAYVYACLGGLVGVLTAGFLGDWILPFFYNVGLTGFRSSILPWIFLGGLVALERMSGAMERGGDLEDSDLENNLGKGSVPRSVGETVVQ